MDNLTTMMVVGGLIRDVLKGRQAEYDALPQPKFTDAEHKGMEMLIGVHGNTFNEKKVPKGRDILELRVYAPDQQCAMTQLHDWLMKEYGVFMDLGPSSGLQLIHPSGVWYIKFAVAKAKWLEEKSNGKNEKEASPSEEPRGNAGDAMAKSTDRND